MVPSVVQQRSCREAYSRPREDTQRQSCQSVHTNPLSQVSHGPCVHLILSDLCDSPVHVHM